MCVCVLMQEETLCLVRVVTGLSDFGGPAVRHDLNRSRVHVRVSVVNAQTTEPLVTVTHFTHVCLFPTVIQCAFSSSRILWFTGCHCEFGDLSVFIINTNIKMMKTMMMMMCFSIVCFSPQRPVFRHLPRVGVLWESEVRSSISPRQTLCQ